MARSFPQAHPKSLAPTQFPSIRAYDAVPANFSISTASDDELTRYGLFFLSRMKRSVRARWAPLLANPKSKVGLQLKPVRQVISKLCQTSGQPPNSTPQGAPSQWTQSWSGCAVPATATTGPWGQIAGIWTVPQVSTPLDIPASTSIVGPTGDVGGWECSIWVGLDGLSGPINTPPYDGITLNSSDVFQVGVVIQIPANGGATVFWPFFEWYIPVIAPSTNPINQQPVPDMTVRPGDSVYGWVGYGVDDQGNPGGNVIFANFSTQQYSGPFFVARPSLSGVTADMSGQTAEWVVERSGGLSGRLPDFGIVSFTSCGGDSSNNVQLSPINGFTMYVDGDIYVDAGGNYVEDSSQAPWTDTLSVTFDHTVTTQYFEPVFLN